jgi:nicotinate-nucleotide pyrophosphorylase (carboxylating)
LNLAFLSGVEVNVNVDQLIETALAEDIGLGDRTSEALLPSHLRGAAAMRAKSPSVLCGIDVAQQVFRAVDPAIIFEALVADGHVADGRGEEIARIEGSMKSILIAERTALNFVQRMSGVATLTRQYVEAVAGTKAQIVDTRKTIPGLRALDKYAVRVGGARNHRFGLFDGVLIKDNHIAAVGGVAEAIRRARTAAPHTLRVEIEAKTLAQVEEAVSASAEIILLDNMSPAMLREAVTMIKGRAITEASGGVNLTTVREIAETGVDLISVGALTHSAVALDISLDVTAA